MEISVSEYNSLIAYTKLICISSGVDPYDVVHEIILFGPPYSKRKICTEYSRQKRASSDQLSFNENKSGRIKVKIREIICKGCMQVLPEGAFRKLTGNRLWRCKICEAEYKKEWDLSNIERIKEKQKIRYENDRAGLIAKTKAYYACNKTQVKARILAWQKSNPTKRKQHYATYYAKNKPEIIKRQLEKRKNLKPNSILDVPDYKILRMNRQLNARQVCEATNICHSTYSLIERKMIRPSRRNAEALAIFFDL